ncbi:MULTISPECIES: hypothetical protein [unclassified Rhizobium]|nr:MULTISPECIES: hypothetical protein [unclassified Rhizobium]
MAYVGYPPKSVSHPEAEKRWGLHGFLGRAALVASILFVAMIIVVL